MKLKTNIFTLLFFVIFLSCNISNYIYSQTKQDFTIRENFTDMLDSLVKPPSSCEEAWNFVTLDSLKTEFVLNTILDKQYSRIDKLIVDINKILNEPKKFDRQIPQSTTGTNPPEDNIPNFPHHQGGMSGEFKDINEDMQDINMAMDKMTVLREKFKNDLTGMQNKTNDELHKTLENDYTGHIHIINDFMKSALKLYNLNNLTFRENMNKVDEVIKKYDYGNKFKFSWLKSEILNIQLAQLNTLKFLLNITKEFVTIGAKFYEEKQKSVN